VAPAETANKNETFAEDVQESVIFKLKAERMIRDSTAAPGSLAIY
jgi:hypothetical protein